MAQENWTDEHGVHEFNPVTGVETVSDPLTGAVIDEINHYLPDTNDNKDEEEDEIDIEEEEEYSNDDDDVDRKKDDDSGDEKKGDEGEDENQKPEQQEGEPSPEQEPGGYDNDFGDEDGYNPSKRASDKTREDARNKLKDKAEERLENAGKKKLEHKAEKELAKKGGQLLAEGTSEFWIPALLVLGGILLVALLVGLIILGFMAYNKDKAAATECTPSGGGNTIVLDPGHISEGVGTAKDDGTATNKDNKGGTGYGQWEYTITWNLTTSLKPKLEAKGYNVVLTKSSEDQFLSNKERTEVANSANASLLFRIHNDDTGADGGGAGGYFILYPDAEGQMNGSPTGAKGPSKEVQDSSKKAADAIGASIKDPFGKIGFPVKSSSKISGNGTAGERAFYGSSDRNGGILTGSIFSKVPVALIEIGNISNKKEHDLLNDSKSIDAITTALANGIEKSTPLTASSSSKITFPVLGAKRAYTGSTKTATSQSNRGKMVTLPEKDWFYEWPIPAVQDKYQDSYGDKGTSTKTSDGEPGFYACRGAKDGSYCKRAHLGADIYANFGTPIVATEDGTITAYGAKAVYDPTESSGGGRGRWLRLKADSGYTYTYMHTLGFSDAILTGAKLTAQPNDVESDSGASVNIKVKAGDIIAYVGNTGGVQNPHLHISVEKDGKSIDPVNVIDGGTATGNSCSSGSADAAGIVSTAKYYVDNPDVYAIDHTLATHKGITDCGGFVATVFNKLKIDDEFVKSADGLHAAQYIDYFKSHPEKYEVVSENVTDTKLLQPGDILLNWKYGSHTGIYLGEKGKNKAEASLRTSSNPGHPPEYGNWYNELHAAVRLK